MKKYFLAFGLWILKNSLFLHSQNLQKDDKENFSTIGKKKKEQARISWKNVQRKWAQSAEKKKS